MPLIHKKRIWWEPVAEVTSYVVYVFKGEKMIDPVNFSWGNTPGIISKEVMGKTELILPDEWPEFPSKPGTYHIAITSKDDVGNESDPFLLLGVFKFIAPPSPSKAGIENPPLGRPEPGSFLPSSIRQGGEIIQEGIKEVRNNKEVQDAYLGRK